MKALLTILAVLSTAGVLLAGSPQEPATEPSQAQRAPGEPPQTVSLGGETTGQKVAVRPGEICRVCNRPVGEHDVAYQVRGQRIAIHRRELSADLAAQLHQLWTNLRPRGSFLGMREDGRGLTWAWFFVGVYILAGLAFGALCAHRAVHSGHRPLVWFGIGLLFNVAGLLAHSLQHKRAVAGPCGVPGGLRKVASTYEPRPCPHCGATNHPAATECAECGGQLEPLVVSEARRVLEHPR